MSGCPIKTSDRSNLVFGGWLGGAPSKPATNNAQINTPSVEESMAHGQAPQPDQTIPLNTMRAVSSIPRGNDDDRDGTSLPSHQKDATATTTTSATTDDGSNWVYPSEQQFYNAMRRKGWQTSESNMNAVVQIHNAVNERTWAQVKRWEQETHDCDNPELVKFVGRPNDPSPKAVINSYLFMRHPPFDRHDWYVKSEAGEVTRYVIDFYNGESSSSANQSSVPSMYLDVRPAIDRPSDVFHRITFAVKDFLPGIFPRR